MANDIIDININQTVETVEINATPNLTTVNINQITGGGGGGGVTNLSTTQTDTNFTINSDTGNDAIVPLANGLLAGATSNDYTTAEKNKLAGIEAGANLGVPYTGATSDVNLGEFGIQLGNLEFDNTPTNIPTTAGSVYYNDADGTLDLILKGGNVTLQVGQETVIRVVNKTSTNITLSEANYQAVRITGAQGQRPKVDLAQATNDVLSAETIGLVTETIANNQEGFITTSGLVRGINTTGSLQGETWLDGDILYLSPTVAGSITKVKPVAPNHLIIIGYVIHAHITQGTIFVKVDNGYELDELHNVKIDTPANNNVLAYTLATNIWENKTVETALGYTPYNATNPSGYQTASQVQSIADAKVSNTITNGVTTSAPNQDVVFDALALKANDANVVHLTGAETINGVKTFTDNLIAGRYLYDGGSIFPQFGSTFYMNGIGATHFFGGGITNLQNNLEVSNGTLNIQLQTASTIASFDANKNVVSLPIATYPSLTELTYVKGVTSAIQTQLNAKQPLSTVLTNTTASFTIADETKLDGIAVGATANSSDATLLARANHTGTQLANTISDFNSATRAEVEAELVAGTNITITPSGTGATRQLTIDASGGGSSSQSAFTVLANNTNASAVPTEQTFKNIAEQTYTQTPAWAGTTAPSGTTNHTYIWSQVGNLVTLRINLSYSVAGSALTSVSLALPSDLPTPETPSSVTTNLDVVNYGNGVLTTTKAALATPVTCYSALRLKTLGTPNIFEIVIARATGAYQYAYASIQYFV